jgi:hypothetical protein
MPWREAANFGDLFPCQLRGRASLAATVMRSFILRMILLAPRRPNAVGLAVALVVVDSMERMLRSWPTPHVFEERFVTMPAWIINPNATCAVVFERAMAWVCAAISHSDPSPVLRRLLSEAAVSVGSVANRRQFPRQATAALARPAKQAALADDAFRSAVARASPF